MELMYSVAPTFDVNGTQQRHSSDGARNHVPPLCVRSTEGLGLWNIASLDRISSPLRQLQIQGLNLLWS
jgi:hypothetical protein